MMLSTNMMEILDAVKAPGPNHETKQCCPPKSKKQSYKRVTRVSGKKARQIRANLIFSQGGLCHYCSVRVVLIKQHPLSPTLDHLVPISRGGTNQQSNLVMACKACNEKKGSMRVDKFLKQRQRYDYAVTTH